MQQQGFIDFATVHQLQALLSAEHVDSQRVREILDLCVKMRSTTLPMAVARSPA